MQNTSWVAMKKYKALFSYRGHCFYPGHASFNVYHQRFDKIKLFWMSQLTVVLISI
jgi:hypothetical protein